MAWGSARPSGTSLRWRLHFNPACVQPLQGVSHGNPLQIQHMARAIAADRQLAAFVVNGTNRQASPTQPRASTVRPRGLAQPELRVSGAPFPSCGGSSFRSPGLWCSRAAIHPCGRWRQARHAHGDIWPNWRCLRGAGPHGRAGTGFADAADVTTRRLHARRPRGDARVNSVRPGARFQIGFSRCRREEVAGVALVARHCSPRIAAVVVSFRMVPGRCAGQGRASGHESKQVGSVVRKPSVVMEFRAGTIAA